ncbi:MAG: hypothetical protein JW982_13980 [Spirochaetes bacterium]|nr:hypothetical protein [Spirochaetota bacterium]
MTVNERLYAAGLIDDFDNAIMKKNFEEAAAILIQTGLTPEQADSAVDVIKNDSKKYGY